MPPILRSMLPIIEEVKYDPTEAQWLSQPARCNLRKARVVFFFDEYRDP